MSLDFESIKSWIVATLDPDGGIRQAAEAQLKNAEKHEGFTDILLTILETEQSQNVKLSAAIYVKNRVNRAWTLVDVYPDERLLTEDEKAQVRNRLLPILGASPGLVRQQLVPLLQRILHWDYPARWPTYMEYTMQLLSTNDAQGVLAGIQCLLAVCRTYRFKASAGVSRDELNAIVDASFAQLLHLCQQLLDLNSEEGGEMLHYALKIYKQAAWLELPPRLRTDNLAWCTVFLRTVSKDPPPSSMVDEPADREKNHWWKAKKWAYFNLNRLFMRHGNTFTISTDNREQIAFANEFTATVAPEILKVYLQQIEKWVAKQIWLSRTCLSYTVVFLEECIRPKEMWPHLQPHLPNLLTHLLFPLLCLSEEDIASFTDEPDEYLHRKLNSYEEVSSPDVSATNFLVCLTKTKRKQVYEILQFVNNVVNTYEQAPPGEKNYVAKDGALRLIGTLAPILLGKKSPIADQVEMFLVRYVLPDFSSDVGILRARACDTIEKFESLDWRDPANLFTVYQRIIDCMADSELPVRITAALALQPLIRHKAIREHMRANIPTIMSQLLKLANEADVDALANVMEDFVEVFSQELTPFAVALSEQLRDTYLRIVRELLDRASRLEDDAEANEIVDDKSITALGVLQTTGTLILTLENMPDVLHHIESVIMPVIRVTLENRLYDLFNEVFEIVDSCTFSAKSISPVMWETFDLFHATFKGGAELYLEDMLPALDNFVQFGAEHLRQNRPRIDALFSMVEDLFADPKVGGADRVCGCRLAEAMMVSLPGAIDDLVSRFIRLALAGLSGGSVNAEGAVVASEAFLSTGAALSVHQVHPRSYRVHLMEMVISAIYYNPLLALSELETIGWTNRFFTMWFGNMNVFSRVHDKKLCISAIVSLLSLPPSSIPASVSVGWPRLLKGALAMFRTLPAAIKNREDALQDDFQFASNGGDDDEWDDADDAWAEEEETNEAASEAKDENTAYIEFLSEEAQKIERMRNQAESTDELGEESLLLESSLDKIEPYQLFRNAVSQLEREQPQFYAGLVGHLAPEEQSTMELVYAQADREAQTAQILFNEQRTLLAENGVPVANVPPSS
ncbi:nonsense-mediated mRNA decay protein [Niveomyces insectorum RCEF 264]|uniref:Nonsense-mediated mRNA decay protein n=1 Tax=Niveomyces insectorum RCEF 264 TaxID=1081102 RepID=A0A167W446_9HYPO|nr:nonsense-mediated mRNA decay protein [Niveomyces insectorum RCEF 264]